MTLHLHRTTLVSAILAIGAAAAGCAHESPAAPAAHTRVVPLGAARTPQAPAPSPAAKAPPTTAAAARNAAIYFDFDSSLLSNDARTSLDTFAAGVVKAGDPPLVIEGNCDETGTVEYNLALGEQRARTAKDYLSRLGVPATRIRTVSYGSQHPKFAGHDDVSHAKNRRDDLRLQ